MEADAPARRPRRTDAGWWPVVLAALALLAGLSGAVVVFEDPAVRSVTMAGAVAVAALVLLRARRRASTHRSGVD